MTTRETREKKPRPIESFGPEILAALLKGATDPIEFTVSYKTAVRFRLRVHQLREAMRRSGHSKYELASRVRVSIVWPEGTETVKQGRHLIPLNRDTKCRVLLRPNDSEFAAALKGIGIDPLDGIATENESPPLVGASTDELRQLLEDLDK